MALIEIEVVRYDDYGNLRPRIIFRSWASPIRKKYANVRWVLWQ